MNDRDIVVDMDGWMVDVNEGCVSRTTRCIGHRDQTVV